MSQLFVLLLLFDKFGFEVLGGDSLDIFALLFDFNNPQSLSFIILHVSLLLQVEFVQKLLTLEACRNLFMVFRFLSRASRCEDEFFALFDLCLLLLLLFPLLLSQILIHLQLFVQLRIFLNLSDLVLHFDLLLMVLFLELSEFAYPEDLSFVAS